MSHLELSGPSAVRVFRQRPQLSKRPQIGLLDHLGGGNLGDDALLDATIHNIKSRWPDADIYGFSMNPDDTRIRHGVPCYPIRTKTWALGASTIENISSRQRLKAAASVHPFLFWPLKTAYAALVKGPYTLVQELRFSAKSLRILRSFDLLIINGGGQLTEVGGPWKFPYTIFNWSLLARMAGVRCIVLNVGAGPLTHPLSKYFVRQSLLSADYVSFRDEQSKALARDINFNGNPDVFPDNAYGLDLTHLVTSRCRESDQRSVVGFAPMAYCDPRVDRHADPAAYSGLIRMLGQFGSWLIEQGYSLKLFCSDIGIDPPTIQDLRAVLHKYSPVKVAHAITAPSIKSNADLLLALGSMDYVITCRFHGVVFAHLMNKPVLALSHHPKVSALMKDLGLSRYCVDIRTNRLECLTDAFVSMVTHTDEIKDHMAERLSCYRKRLSMQFDLLFPTRRVEQPD